MYNILTIVAQMGIVTLLSCQINRKWFERKRWCLWGILVGVYALVNETLLAGIWGIAHYFIIVLIIGVVYWRVSALRIVYATLLSCAILIYTQAVCINWIPAGWIAEDYNRAGFVINICVALIILFAEAVLKWRKIELHYVQESLRGKIVLSLIAVVVLLFCVYFEPVLRTQYYIQERALLLLSGLVLIAVLLVFYRASEIRYRKIIESLRQQIRIYEEDKRENQLRLHEYKKELQIIKAMAERDISLLQYKLGQEEQESLYQELQPVLRDIIRSYAEIFANKGIELKMEATGLIPHFEIDDASLVSIVGNLMDNAVDAVKELPPEERFIKLELGQEDGQKWLCMSNPYKHHEEADEDIMKRGVSSKGSGRGNGLYIVNKAVKKYGGEVRIIREKEFHIMVSFCEISK